MIEIGDHRTGSVLHLLVFEQFFISVADAHRHLSLADKGGQHVVVRACLLLHPLLDALEVCPVHAIAAGGEQSHLLMMDAADDLPHLLAEAASVAPASRHLPLRSAAASRSPRSAPVSACCGSPRQSMPCCRCENQTILRISSIVIPLSMLHSSFYLYYNMFSVIVN